MKPPVIIKIPGHMGLAVNEKYITLTENEILNMISVLKTIDGYCQDDDAGHMQYFKSLCEAVTTKFW